MVEFGELHPDGTLVNRRTIPQTEIMRCPHLIMVPEHYRDDNTCRCDDPDHTEMREWGYVWSGAAWI